MQKSGTPTRPTPPHLPCSQVHLSRLDVHVQQVHNRFVSALQMLVANIVSWLYLRADVPKF